MVFVADCEVEVVFVADELCVRSYEASGALRSSRYWKFRYSQKACESKYLGVGLMKMRS